MDITKFIKQDHREIKRLLDQIDHQLLASENKELDVEVPTLVELWRQLNTILSAHLQSEEITLYQPLSVSDLNTRESIGESFVEHTQINELLDDLCSMNVFD